MAQSLKLLLCLSWLWLAGPRAEGEILLLHGSLSSQEQSLLDRGLGWMEEFFTSQGLAVQPRVQVRVFDRYEEFRDFQRVDRARVPTHQLSPSGYYSTRHKVLVLWRSRRFLQIFLHESQHALLRSAFPNPPKWINEGLSECFEGISLDQESLVVQPQGPRLRKLKRHLSPDLGEQILEVLWMGDRSFVEQANDRGLDSYTRGWALVYFLWSQPEGPRRLGELLRGLQSGQRAVDVLEQQHPGGLSQLKEDLLQFYTSLELPVESRERVSAGADEPRP